MTIPPPENRSLEISGDDAVAQWRQETPGCAHRVHLNNAGAALMPLPVIRAIQDHIELESSIGGYEAADSKAPAVEKVYRDLASLLNCSSRNIAIVANATAGFIQTLSAFDFSAGDIIITSRSDYTSYQIQYLALAKRRAVRIEHAADLPDGGIDPEAVRRLLIRESTCRLVSVSWVPTHSGLVQDVASVGAICEEFGVAFHVDACQAIGQLPVDVSQLRCDYLTATARKFLRGPRGVGFLYVSDRALARGDYPLYIDMRGAEWTRPNEFRASETARRFEDWEFPYALVLGLGAAAVYALGVGIVTASRRAFELAAYTRSRLEALNGVEVLDRGRVTCAIVTAMCNYAGASDIVAALARSKINTTATLHWYGLLDFGKRGIQSAVRISPHYYNTTSEIDKLIEIVANLAALRPKSFSLGGITRIEQT